MNLPRHIAIIPDGNRRWAKEKGLNPWEGHSAGAAQMEQLARWAFNNGIYCLSFWGSSLENLQKRPLREKQELLKIYEDYFKKLMVDEDIHRNRVRINVIGKWEQQFPSSLKRIIMEGVEKTAHYDQHELNFFLAYSGDDEMLDTVRKIAASGISPESITAETIKQNLMTSKLPAVDLLIRTGGEPHLSAGFMMWDIANSALYFSKKYFPDFNENELAEAIAEYGGNEKRNGK
ncbi:MAG: di-trans,poly-cis-decaprenylcistransferase [Candidatus Moranbacteria bacterium]|nr:di-trans,poly-cis-decaprenylcistransferase [Candidatus Moranbacteria bacterium]